MDGPLAETDWQLLQRKLQQKAWSCTCGEMCCEDTLIPFAKFSRRQEANGVSSFSEEVLVLAACHFSFPFLIHCCPFAGLPFFQGCPFPGLLLCRGNKILVLPGTKTLPQCACSFKKMKHGAGLGNLGAAFFHHTGLHFFQLMRMAKGATEAPRDKTLFQGLPFLRALPFLKAHACKCLHFWRPFWTFFSAKAASKRMSLQVSRLSLFPFLETFLALTGKAAMPSGLHCQPYPSHL